MKHIVISLKDNTRRVFRTLPRAEKFAISNYGCEFMIQSLHG